MSATRNLQLITPYLVCSLEGVTHGIYLIWLTAHRGISPVAAALALAFGDAALLVLEVPTGIFADRVGARRSLLAGSLCQAVGILLFWRAAAVVTVFAAAFAIALGDAFRHGADQAILYRSCASVGREDSFGRRFAAAEAWALGAMVCLCALGGWIAERVSFDAAWMLDLALSASGFGVAGAMTDPPVVSDPDEDAEPPALASLGARLPMSLILPAAATVSFAAVAELLVQTHARSAFSALIISGALAVESLATALVARGGIPITTRALHAGAWVALVGIGLIALAPRSPFLGVLLLSLGAGVAPPIRSALLQGAAKDSERATVASAAAAIDTLGRLLLLPAAAWLFS